jgi:CDP-6-deoxy-D-xylo-4-hexulose-3-dehydrase
VPEGTRVVEWTQQTWDEAEIQAVTDLLRTTTVLQVGDKVQELEARVAQLFDKSFGVMTNSGTSALYLAVELLDLDPGDEILTTVMTFSADVAPILRAGLIPVFIDVEFDTYNVDVDQIEGLIGPRTKAILVPNLIGNAPDWERIREIADRHGLKVIEDSADTLGAKLRGKPTGYWSDISITSFAQSHIITSGGAGGMVCMNSEAEHDRALLLRRWGRRCEVQMFGSRKDKGERFEDELSDGLVYDSFVIFDEVGWNFEPTEMHAAFALVQLDKMEGFNAIRRAHFDRHTHYFSHRPDYFVPARETEDLETSWICYPLMIRPEAPFDRAEFMAYMEPRGITPRMAWSGNMLRQPAYMNAPHRAAPGGYPNANRAMEHTTTLPMSQSIRPDEIDYIHACCESLISERSSG